MALFHSSKHKAVINDYVNVRLNFITNICWLANVHYLFLLQSDLLYNDYILLRLPVQMDQVIHEYKHHILKQVSWGNLR